MSSSAQKSTVVKKKLVKKRLILIEDEEQQPTQRTPQKSVWLYMSRNKKIIQDPFLWESIEDISDDENDTPQAAGKRLSTLKAVRDKICRRAYAYKLEQFQDAGLLSTLSGPKLLETHSNYDYQVQSTYAFPI